MEWCVKCANTGLLRDGSPCDCKFSATTFYDAVSCLDIPEQYRGVKFNRALLPHDMDPSYADYLEHVHSAVTTNKWGVKNVLIASPISHGKTIMAYSCIESMFRNGWDVFPLYDALELYRIITDMDLGKKQTYDVKEPERIMTIPVLFVRIPRITRYELYDCIALIVDRRVRKGNSTIFLYSGKYATLVNGDRNGILTGMMGNGSFGTIDVKSWSSKNSEKEIELQENIG